MQGNFAEEIGGQLRRDLARPAVTENIAGLAAIGANEGRHILDNAEHRNIDLAEHLQTLAGVDQGNILRCGDDHRAGDRHFLGQCQLRVAGARRHVDHQHIQLAPGNIVEHLAHRAGHHWAAPDHRAILVNQETHGHQRHAVADNRRYLVAVALGLLPGAQHLRDRRAIDIGVQQADLQAHALQGQRQVDRDGGFTNAALAAGHRNDGLDAGDRLGAGHGRIFLPHAGHFRRRARRLRGAISSCSSCRAGAFGGQHHAGAHYAGQCLDHILTGFAQRLGGFAVHRATVIAADIQRESDIATLYYQARYHIQADHIAAALRIDNAL